VSTPSTDGNDPLTHIPGRKVFHSSARDRLAHYGFKNTRDMGLCYHESSRAPESWVLDSPGSYNRSNETPRPGSCVGGG